MVTWIKRINARLRGIIDEVIDIVAAIEVKPNDILGAERRARTIANLARAAKAVEALKARRVRSRPTPTKEDARDQDEDGDDTAELDRVRCELDTRLDRLRATVEASRVDGWTVVTADTAGPRHSL